jgi:hypothetical protein
MGNANASRLGGLVSPAGITANVFRTGAECGLARAPLPAWRRYLL